MSILTSYSANHTWFSIFQQYIAMPIMAGYSATSYLRMTKVQFDHDVEWE